MPTLPTPRSLALLAALSAALSAPAVAYQPLITDDTGTQGTGGNQIEFSYNHEDGKSEGATTTTRTFPFVYTRGLTDALDVYAGLSHVRIRPPAPDPRVSGGGNPVVGLKWRFYENEADKLSLAFKPEIQIPVSSSAENRGLGNARTNAGAMLILTQETGFGAVHVNLAVVTNRLELQANRDANRRTLYRLSVAPVFEPAEGWKIALDAGLTANPDKAEKARMGYVELGVVYSPNKDLDFALGIIRDVHDGERRTTTGTIGVTWRFK